MYILILYFRYLEEENRIKIKGVTLLLHPFPYSKVLHTLLTYSVIMTLYTLTDDGHMYPQHNGLHPI